MSYALLTVAAIGHVILWAAIVNRLHGLGIERRWIDAATAASVGLITEAVPGERLEERVVERVAAMEALDPAAVREIKRFFVHVRTMDAPSAAAIRSGRARR